MVAPITVVLNADDSGLSQGLKAGSRSIKAFGQDVGVNLPPKLNLAVQGIKGVVKVTGAVGKAAKDAGAEEQIFQDVMSKATGVSADYNAALNDTIVSSQKLAFSDTETRKALASLTTATGDAALSQELLAGAQDIARASGVSLESAADAVSKAYVGNDMALARMLPGLEKGATAQETIANATNLAAGAADSFASSSEAMGIKATNAFGEIAEEVGGHLAPGLEELGKALRPLIKSFANLVSTLLPPLLKLLSGVFKVISGGINIVNGFVSAIRNLVNAIKSLLGPLTEAVNKLKDLDILNRKTSGVGGNAVTQVTRVAAMGVEPTANTNRAAGVTINIYGDPSVIEARVTKALRDYARRNGVGAVFTPERT